MWRTASVSVSMIQTAVARSVMTGVPISGMPHPTVARKRAEDRLVTPIFNADTVAAHAVVLRPDGFVRQVLRSTHNHDDYQKEAHPEVQERCRRAFPCP